MAYRQWQHLHGTPDPGLRDRSQSRPLLHSHSKPGIEWHLRELRQNLQARLCSREPSSGCDHRTPADRRMVLGLQRKPSPFWAQNALPKGVHASSITIALCPVKRGQLHTPTTLLRRPDGKFMVLQAGLSARGTKRLKRGHPIRIRPAPPPASPTPSRHPNSSEIAPWPLPESPRTFRNFPPTG